MKQIHIIMGNSGCVPLLLFNRLDGRMDHNATLEAASGNS